MSEDQLILSRRSGNSNSSIFLINRKYPHKPMFCQFGKNSTFYDLKLKLLNFFDKRVKSLITGFRLVREGSPEDNDNDTISDNYFDDKYNDAKICDSIKLIENKQIYKKMKMAISLFILGQSC